MAVVWALPLLPPPPVPSERLLVNDGAKEQESD